MQLDPPEAAIQPPDWRPDNFFAQNVAIGYTLNRLDGKKPVDALAEGVETAVIMELAWPLKRQIGAAVLGFVTGLMSNAYFADYVGLGDTERVFSMFGFIFFGIALWWGMLRPKGHPRRSFDLRSHLKDKPALMLVSTGDRP